MNPLKQFFEEYASKACSEKGPIRDEADRASRWFWSHLTDQDKQELALTRLKALACKQDRKGFDSVCKKIRERLFKK